MWTDGTIRIKSHPALRGTAGQTRRGINNSRKRQTREKPQTKAHHGAPESPRQHSAFTSQGTGTGKPLCCCNAGLKFWLPGNP